MLNSRQLVVEIDSMNAKQAQKMEENKYDYNELIQIGLESFDLKKYINGTSNGQDIEIDTQTNETVSVRKSLMDKNISTVLLNKKDVALDSLNNVLAWITPDVRATVIDLARKKNGTLKTRTWNNYSQVRNINYSKQDFVRSLNVQYSWAIVCILFLFIGAPMGAIVRKGGFGYPMLVAIGFYMFFIILTILSERLQKSSVIDGFQAGWLPCIVLLPFAAITSYMAMNDIKIDRSFFISWIPIRKKNLVVP
jgi:lipopolysaccharide export system permease protein